jgi:hypothetical protein
MPRVTKFEPGRVRIDSCAPLKPPRETSYGVVTSDVEIAASRGRLEPPNSIPLRVMLFWSAPSPSTEKPFGAPSSPGTSCTPGSVAAIAARSPSRSAETFAVSTGRSVPPTSGVGTLRLTRSRWARTCTASSTAPTFASLASATRISSSAVRFTSKRFAA